MESESGRRFGGDIGRLLIAANMGDADHQNANKLNIVVCIDVDSLCLRGGLLMCCKI